MKLSILTYNVGYRALKGINPKEITYYQRPDGTTGTYLPEQVPNSDGGSQGFEKISHFLEEQNSKNDIIILLEPVSGLASIFKNKTLYRFWKRSKTTSEALIIACRPDLRPTWTGLVGIQTSIDARYRPVAVMVFASQRFILVAAHLPHPPRNDMSLYIRMLRDILVKMFGMEIYNYQLIISGDFNTNSAMEKFVNVNNSYLQKPTNFVLVADSWRQKFGELPMQFAYDRFLHTSPVQLLDFEVICTPEMLCGLLSDHLPIKAQFMISREEPEPVLKSADISINWGRHISSSYRDAVNRLEEGESIFKSYLSEVVDADSLKDKPWRPSSRPTEGSRPPSLNTRRQ